MIILIKNIIETDNNRKFKIIRKCKFKNLKTNHFIYNLKYIMPYVIWIEDEEIHYHAIHKGSNSAQLLEIDKNMKIYEIKEIKYKIKEIYRY